MNARAVVTLLLLGSAASSLASPGRRLLADDSPALSPSPKPASALDAFVPSPKPGRLASELVPLYESLRDNEELVANVLACSEATGIASIASEFSGMLLGGISAFRKYGFCSLNKLSEEKDRLTYMLSYALSLHLRGKLQSEYTCEGMEELPEQCAFGPLIETAVEAASAEHRGDSFCSDVASDSSKAVTVLSLPEDWQPKAPQFRCTPREDARP